MTSGSKLLHNLVKYHVPFSKGIHRFTLTLNKIASFTYDETSNTILPTPFLFQKSANGDPLETKFP